jgi:glycine dehydrogenase
VIRAFHESRGQGHRDVCLIPSSAHGTNPASAVMAGLPGRRCRVRRRRQRRLADLEAKARQHKDALAALMVTYPSTHGVFEAEIRSICKITHEQRRPGVHGRRQPERAGRACAGPADIGADVCHINLHKTFCIPHGGGGPGMGPISVRAHLAPFLPRHPVVATGGRPRHRRRVGGAVGQRQHPADLVDVHPADGRRRACSRAPRSRS